MARDADGEVWVERGAQLTTLNPHRKVRFDAMRLTLNHVVVGLASSDEQERGEHGRVARTEFDPGPTDRAGRGPTSESCRGAGGPVSHLRGHTPRRACEPLALAAWGTPIDKRLSLYCWARCRDAAREPRARLDKTTSASRPLGARAPGWRGPGWPGREAEPIEPAGAAAECGVSHACSAERRLLSGDASSLRSRGALIALWIQAVPAAAMLDHSCAVS